MAHVSERKEDVEGRIFLVGLWSSGMDAVDAAEVFSKFYKVSMTEVVADVVVIFDYLDNILSQKAINNVGSHLDCRR